MQTCEYQYYHCWIGPPTNAWAKVTDDTMDSCVRTEAIVGDIWTCTEPTSTQLITQDVIDDIDAVPSMLLASIFMLCVIFGYIFGRHKNGLSGEVHKQHI